jgi:hypothetical protein
MQLASGVRLRERLGVAVVGRVVRVLDRLGLPLGCYRRAHLAASLLRAVGCPAHVCYGVRASPSGPVGHCWVDRLAGPTSDAWELIWTE